MQVVEHAAQPYAGERAELMEQEHDATEHGEMPHAEYRSHDAVGQRNRREPQQADGDTEQVGAGGAQRQKDKGRDHRAARQVDPAQYAWLGVDAAQPAGGIVAENIKQANQSQGSAADLSD